MARPVVAPTPGLRRWRAPLYPAQVLASAAFAPSPGGAFSPPAARYRRHLIQEPALAHPSPALDQDDGPDAGKEVIEVLA